MRASGATAGVPLILSTDDKYVFASERSNAVAIAESFYRKLRQQLKEKLDFEVDDNNRDSTLDDLENVYTEETRAFYERERYNRSEGSVCTGYWVLNDVYSLDRKVIKVRLHKRIIESREIRRLLLMSKTLTVATAYPPGVESRALRKLKELVTPIDYERYLASGTIFLKGKSGLTYYVRRSRPTIAMREGDPLCALCLHPLAYVHESWAGIMPPTDEVIAHILFIRGDEHAFWKKANQHPITEPVSGV
jgi:hypothetical protein